MSEFSVDPEALRRLAKGLILHADAAAGARSYAEGWLAGPSADGDRFTWVDGARVAAADATVAGLESLQRALAASSDELEASARYYDETDAAQAAELDDDLAAPPQGGANGDEPRGA